VAVDEQVVGVLHEVQRIDQQLFLADELLLGVFESLSDCLFERGVPVSGRLASSGTWKLGLF